MAQPNWWDQDEVVRPAQTQMDPIVKPAMTPQQQAAEARAQAAEARAQQDQALQIDAANRSERADARAEESSQRGTEAQSKAAVLLGRIKGGAADINDIVSSFPDAQRPGISETLLYGCLLYTSPSPRDRG